MYPSRFSYPLIILLIGDALTLALVTLAGLGFHEEIGRFSARLWPTFLPMLVGWLLVAPHLHAFDIKRAVDPSSLWRPPWAMFLSAPFGLWLRGLWLGTAIVPIFVLVMGGISALAVLGWRGLFLVLFRNHAISEWMKQP